MLRLLNFSFRHRSKLFRTSFRDQTAQRPLNGRWKASQRLSRDRSSELVQRSLRGQLEINIKIARFIVQMPFRCCPDVVQAHSHAVGFAVRWKSTFPYVRMSFCPENVGNWSYSPQNDLEFSPRSIRSCFPLLHGPSCRKSPSALFLSNWVTIPDRIEKTFFRSGRRMYAYLTLLDRKSADGDFLQLCPWRSWKQLWIDLGEKSFWGGEDQFPTFSEFMRTYWKVLCQRNANSTA